MKIMHLHCILTEPIMRIYNRYYVLDKTDKFCHRVYVMNNMETTKKKSFDIEDYLYRVKSFHGHLAPGVVIGGYMVHLANTQMPEGILFDAISETPACVPDAIQLLTPCTVGNGWLKIINLGRFALSLYDKYHGNGVRVFLDTGKLENWPEIKDWFLKLKSRAEQRQEDILSQIREAGSEICSVRPVQIKTEFLKKRDKGKIEICSSCKEAYPLRDGIICLACQGSSPYISSDIA